MIVDFFSRFRYPSKDYFTQTIVTKEHEALVLNLVIDPVYDHMYLVEYTYGKIQRSDLKGRNITTIIAIEFISTLDIDIQNRLVKM